MQTRARSRSQGAEPRVQAAAQPAQQLQDAALAHQQAAAQPAQQAAGQPAQQGGQAVVAAPQVVISIPDRGTQENNIDRRIAVIASFETTRPWTLQRWLEDFESAVKNTMALLHPDQLTQQYS